MNKFAWLVSLVVAAAPAFSACSKQDSAGKAQGEVAAGHADEGLAVTQYTDTTELFVEFPKLVKGEGAAFAAHLTRITPKGFEPVTAGRLTVKLVGGPGPDESAEVDISPTPGIFRPVIKPQFAGKRRLIFVLTTQPAPVTHDLGEVDVHPDKKTAEQAAVWHESDPGIRFTKEQQWKIPFANQPVAETSLRESVPAVATLRPRAGGEAIIAAPTAGLLRAGAGELPHIGSKVRAGQVLGYLVPRLGGESDSATLQLAVERASLEVEQARQARERLEELWRVEAVPEKRVVEARGREQVAAAELSAARRRAATYAGGAGGIALKSPIAGVVVAVGASAGAAVSNGQTLIHVADLNTLWLEARISETDLARIAQPGGVFFRLDGEESGRVLEIGKNARLIAFGGLVDKESRTVPAIFEFANRDQRLRVGMGLRVGVYTGRVEKALAVPTLAVVDDNGQPVVYVQKEGESFERRVVTPGTRDGDRIALRSGVAAGERVVTLGAPQVRLAALAPAAAGHGHSH